MIFKCAKFQNNCEKMLTVLVLFLIFILNCVCGNESYFAYCIKEQPSLGVVNCIGKQALHTLTEFDDSENVTVANGLVLRKEDGQKSRILSNLLDQDPSDFR